MPRVRPLTALRRAAVGAAVVAAPVVAEGQVGHPPAASPFRDLTYKQEVVVGAGWFDTGRDPAGVAPQAAPFAFTRYALQFRNPVIFSAQLGVVPTERRVLDPQRAPDARYVGDRQVNLGVLDVSLGLALTGFRSWRHLVPEVRGGAGFISDFKDTDLGGFDFGTPFAFHVGGGVRWVKWERWTVRADVTDRLYRVSYPQSYFQRQVAGQPAILEDRDSNSAWTHNLSLAIGLGYAFDR